MKEVALNQLDLTDLAERRNRRSDWSNGAESTTIKSLVQRHQSKQWTDFCRWEERIIS